ncbi:ABC transporter substrate-binding protein [Paraburkholderia caballeronis]|uniref:ABC transporter substrate-binding protein n=1 Tax=Paraburkholderia caballeronis TaxID=416943 RepID=UPI00106593D5|nr:ABC transporter substrate-binding protein [Paraburkholderia caballeronis]TDV13967.1 ABC-type nitrate/sulfonate/bicarbonate transport system substrate-binding protein [Paraburkholderia caballeronis]TDV15480.1 ABC-type nitrate/sulfonate/bicarbonate transport system substrate-binding protein [Paraburkholderia caballeronis]TDV24948.1 ABC-type nitrate/sulfonate/bicarbonate transport system substrate-binding protein [Paraburkholderia caballeronis]
MSRLWYTRCPAPTPFGIAAQQGLLQQEFAADGIDVAALQDADDVLIRRSHFTHSQPWSFRQGGNIPALWARSQGSDTRLIGVSWVDEFQALLTLDPHLEATRASLAGRRFGLPLNTRAQVVDFHRATALRGFASLLDAAGASLADVELIELPHAPRGLEDAKPAADAPIGAWLDAQRSHEFAREAQALLRGEVDVVFVKGATGLDIANVTGARVLIDIGAQRDRRLHANNGTPRPLTVDAQLLRERPDLVERVLVRTLDVGDWAGAHPVEVASYIGREVRSAEHWVRRAYPGGLHRQLAIGLDADALDALSNFKRFLFEHAFIPNDFDFAQWVDPAPLAAALERRQAAGRAAA